MAARTHIVDSGGTARLLKRWFVVDSGGTTRLAKRVFVVDSGGTARLVFQGIVFRLDATTYSRANTGGASATFRLNSDGQVYVGDDSSGGVVTARYNWVTPTSAAANYDCRWTQGAGAVDTTPGAVSTNLNLGTTRGWVETNGASFETTTFTVSIYATGDAATPLASATITLEVDGS